MTCIMGLQILIFFLCKKADIKRMNGKHFFVCIAEKFISLISFESSNKYSEIKQKY